MQIIFFVCLNFIFNGYEFVKSHFAHLMALFSASISLFLSSWLACLRLQPVSLCLLGSDMVVLQRLTNLKFRFGAAVPQHLL